MYETDVKELIESWEKQVAIYENSKYKEYDFAAKKVKGNIAAVVNDVVTDILAGDVNYLNIDKEVIKRLEKYFEGNDVARKIVKSTLAPGYDALKEDIDDIKDTFRRREAAIAGLKGLSYSTEQEEAASKLLEKTKNDIKQIDAYYNQLLQVQEAFVKSELSSDEAAKKTKDILQKAQKDGLEPYIKLLEDADKALSNASKNGAYEFKKSQIEIYKSLKDGQSEIVRDTEAMQQVFAENKQLGAYFTINKDVAKEMFANFAEDLEKQARDIDLKGMQKAIVAASDKIVRDFKLSDEAKDLFAQLIPTNEEATSQVIAKISGFLEQYESLKKQYKTSIKAGGEEIGFVSWINKDSQTETKRAIDAYLQGSAEILARNEELIPALKAYRELLGGDAKSKNKGELEKLKKQIQLVRELADAYEKMWKEYGKEYADANIWDDMRKEAFSELDLNWKEFGVGTRQNELENLGKLLPIATKLKGGYLAVARAMAEVNTELDSIAQKAKNEDLARQFEKLFGNYELTLELDKLNIPPDLAGKLFGFDPISLTEIRNATLDKFGLGEMKDKTNADVFNSQEYKNLSDEAQKQISDNLKKINDLQDKALIEYGKRYSKYLLKAQSDRVKIKLEEVRQLEDIELMYQQNRIDAEMKTRMQLGVKEETQKSLDKQAWKDFQDTEMYIRLFDNLEGASTRSINRMREKLVELRDSLKELDPASLKALNDQIDKLDKIAIENNPFKGMIDDAKTYFDYIKNKDEWETSYESKLQQVKTSEDIRDNLQLNIDAQEKELAAKEALLGKDNEQVIALREKLKLDKQALDVLLAQLVVQKKLTQEDADKLRNGQNAGKNLLTKINTTSSEISAIVSFTGEMAKNLEDAFGMSDNLKDAFTLIQGIGGGITDLLSGGAGLLSGDPFKMIQGGIQVVSGISKVVSSFNQFYDDKKQRQIEREIKLVNNLSKMYEKLEKSIENAYSIDTFQEANINAQENIEQQIEAKKRIIQLEKDKKETDWEAIQQYNDEIEELLEQSQELERERLKGLGGTGGEDNYKDVAQSFVDVWLDGFMEIGDGLTNLEDEFDTLLLNIAKKQLMLKATDKFLAPLYKAIDDAVYDTEVTKEEMADIEAKAKEALPQLNDFLKKLMEEMGLTDLSGSNGELATLSGGIKGISETQADTISAYLNSIRFIVSDSNLQLKTLVELQSTLSNSTASEMSKAASRNGIWNNDEDTANPMLPQLRMIAEQTAAINSLLNSLTAPHPTLSGRGLKVVI